MIDSKNLRALRGLAAILIFYHHFGFHSPVTAAFGDYAVSLFFMLSGLVLTATFRQPDSYPKSDNSHHSDNFNQPYYYHQSDNNRLFGKAIAYFLRKRFIKIYPLYLLSLLAMIILKGIYLPALPFDILLLQSWIPLQEFFFSGNAVSWFVSSLFLSYLLFIPTYDLLNRNIRKALTIFLGGLILLYFPVVLLIPDNLVLGIVYVNPVMQLPTFFIGMLVWKLYENRQIHHATGMTKHQRHHAAGMTNHQQCHAVGMTSGQGNLILTVVIIAIVVAIWIYRFIDERFSLASYWWPLNFLTLYVMLQTEGLNIPIIWVLRMKIPQTIGNISFSFYLFHLIFIDVYRRCLAFLHVDLNMILSSLICLAISLPAAWVLHRYLELPIAHLLSRHR